MDRGSEKNTPGTRGATNRAHQLGMAGWQCRGEKEDVVESKYRERNTWPSVLSPPLQRHKKTLLF